LAPVLKTHGWVCQPCLPTITWSILGGSTAAFALRAGALAIPLLPAAIQLSRKPSS